MPKSKSRFTSSVNFMDYSPEGYASHRLGGVLLLMGNSLKDAFEYMEKFIIADRTEIETLRATIDTLNERLGQ